MENKSIIVTNRVFVGCLKMCENAFQKSPEQTAFWTFIRTTTPLTPPDDGGYYKNVVLA